jgi:hypothetical protein
MRAPLASGLDEERMDVQWVDCSFVVGKEGGEALYQADPVHRTIHSAAADALKSLAARRTQAVQLKSKVDELIRKLGGRDPDIWPAPQSTNPLALQ